MKSFKDLEFKPHPVMSGLQAVMIFDNGYGVSVVRFKTMFGSYGSYTDNEDQWELAVIEGTADEFEINYSTSVTDDVIGRLSSEDVTELMHKVQKLSQQLNQVYVN